MRYVLVACVLLFASPVLAEQPPPSGAGATFVQTPRLGVPFGTIVEVEGSLVPEAEKRTKSEMGATMLKIVAVNGRALAEPVVLELRGDELDLLPAGTPMRWAGYESGGFEGLPAGAFEYIPPCTSKGFGFHHWFVGLKRVPERTP